MRNKIGKPRRPGRPRRLAEQDARTQLLDAAIELFAEQGIAATTVAEIADHAGVTPAMVHYYFKNREQLLDALVEERLMRFISSVWDPVTDCEEEPLAMLTGVVRRMIEVADQMPSVPSLWVKEILSASGLLRERVLKRLPHNKLTHLSSSVATAQRQGTINPDIDAGLIILSLFGLTMIPLAAAKIVQRVTNVETLNKDTLARHVTALLSHGLSKPQRKHRSGRRDINSISRRRHLPMSKPASTRRNST